MSVTALTPSQEAIAPVETVTAEQLPDYQPEFRRRKREAWIEAAVIVSLWGMTMWFYRNIPIVITGVSLVYITALFERTPVSNGTIGTPSCELASEDQSRRYWERLRFSQKGHWVFYAMLFGCLFASKFLPSTFGAATAFFLGMCSFIPLTVSALGRNCPRCLERLSVGHVRGHCSKCGIFFRTERKALQQTV